MSWYNENGENNFIDATQEFIGGASTSVSIIQNAEDLVIEETVPDTEEETTIGNVLLPAVLNEGTGTYDLYIRNVNQGGKIFFTTRGTSEKVKIEDGKLKLYSAGGWQYDANNAEALDANEVVSDYFNYTISDGNGGEDTAVIEVKVRGQNDAPVIAVTARLS